MMWIKRCIFLFVPFITILHVGSTHVLVKYVEEGKVEIGNENKYSQNFEIYCYKGRLKHILHMWETVQFHLSLLPDEFSQFDGVTPEEVTVKYINQKTSWNINILTKRQSIKLNPFNQTCVGILTDKNYEVKILKIRVDYWRILLCLFGFVLFISAGSLSSNSLFYYLTGISLGISASILIFVYILSRFMPKKPVMYSFLAGGWTVGIYLVQLLWDNIRLILVEYKMYVFYYIFGTGLLSFVVCYRYGPVSDPKSINLIKWTLQAVALLLVFVSSDFQEAAMSLNMCLLMYYNLPFKTIWQFFYRINKKWFPPKPRFLSEDEYYQQGVIETGKALDDLRGYCSSPECNQWQTILKLKNPLRFAKFMEGSSHLLDDEVLAFETDTKSLKDALITDDSSSE